MQPTILIPSSPIASHPDTAILEETLASIQKHLPKAEIIVMFDGVRPEQEHYRDAYEEYKRRALWLLNQRGNVFPLLFEEHQHQANMTRKALELARSPLILFMEHDTPLTPDRPIEWEKLYNLILTGDADMIRFHFEAQIPDEHWPMMFDKEPIEAGGTKMIRTMQWSQRPHLASRAFYRRIIQDYFPPNAKTMIEDQMHGIVHNACLKDGINGWHNFRIWIYTPEENIKRSYTTDGRQTDPKYPMDFGSWGN